MVRRLVIIACCIVVCGAPLADALCYADCANRETSSGAHHSCTAQGNDATAISAAPHSCPIGDEVVSRSVDVRHTIVVLALPPSVPFDPSRPAVIFTNGARSHAIDSSPQVKTPLRI